MQLAGALLKPKLKKFLEIPSKKSSYISGNETSQL